jgi:predicted GH43/DUF377 family glycosyl hydrolase
VPHLPQLRRSPVRLAPDPARVVIRPFRPATEPRDLNPTDKSRANHIVDRVLGLDTDEAEHQLADVIGGFAGRHHDLAAVFAARADEMEAALRLHDTFTPTQRQLVGAYFMQEYSFEASALFNPSIVPHPDQSGLPAGSLRFVMSLRAIGEGHISSLTFRSGEIDVDGRVRIHLKSAMATIPRVVRREATPAGDSVVLRFSGDEDLCERVIFPVTDQQSNGIEDARFVAFEDGGRRTYYATYTAYSGRAIRSELLQTDDFTEFRLTPLTGDAAHNKGMALFPRKLDGGYAMIGRQDNENLYLLRSDDLTTWTGGTAILKPQFPWEFVQIGNCGAPIELDEGWLLLTHGVGPVRKYAIGAALLDKNDPTRVLARTAEPLVRPDPSEREGYVPNVAYTCGALRFADQIVLPYAVADTFTSVSTVAIADLLAGMTPC